MTDDLRKKENQMKKKVRVIRHVEVVTDFWVEANDDNEAMDKTYGMFEDGSFYDLKPNLDCAEDETVEESKNTVSMEIMVIS